MIDELDIGWSGNIKNIIINEELNQDQLNELKEIINRHQIIFGNKPGAAKIECHKIPLTTNVPIITHPYKIPFAQQNKVYLALKESLLKIEKFYNKMPNFASP